MDGLECEHCQAKTPSTKGQTIARFPPVLTFSLTRIEIDWYSENMERKKLNSRFEYPLELDLKKYSDDHMLEENPEAYLYELKSIVIHRGGPYGGHYHAFIKDDLKEGNWDVEVPESFAEKPTEKVNPAREEYEKMKAAELAKQKELAELEEEEQKQN